MKKRNTLTKLIVVAMILSAMALIGSAWAAERTQSQNNLKQMSLACIGFGDGQTLRLSTFSANPSEGRQPVRASARLYDAAGNVLAQTEEADLQPGRLCIFDFKRADLRASGEPGTGRLQVRAEIIYRLGDNSQRITPDELPAALELINNSTGGTILFGKTYVFSGWAHFE